MSPRPRGPSSTPCTARGWSASSPSWTRRTSPRSAWRFASAWSGGRAHHGVLRRRDRALPLHPSPRSADGPAARGVGAAPGGGVRPPAVRRGLLSPSRQEGPWSGRDRRDGAGGRVRGGAGGAPGTVRGGGVSESVAKAPRVGIGREKKRGVSTILFRRFGAIRAFATDLDKRRTHGPLHGRRPRRSPRSRPRVGPPPPPGRRDV